MLAHRSTSNAQMSNESSTSSSSSDTSGDDDSSGEEDSYEDDDNKNETSSKGSYLHDPWLLQNREISGIDDEIGTTQVELAQNNSENSSSNSSSSGNESSDSGDNDDSKSSASEEETLIKSPSKITPRKKDVPDWELNPEVYGLRRSSRQRKEPSRLSFRDDESADEIDSKKQKRIRKRRDRDGPASLSNSSEDESSEYEAPMQRKTSTRAVGRPSKLAQIRAKLQRKNIKTTKNRKTKVGRSKGRSRTISNQDSSSEDNQPVRSSSRLLRNNKISYKEHDSSQETDSDEIVEATENWNGVEDDGSEAVEKIMDFRVGRLGATGGRTTAYACAEEGDPNLDFDPSNEEGEKQYLIKWKGWAHPHNTWESEATLQAQQVRGMKRFENFVKRQEELDLWLRNASPEDKEYYYCQSEMNRTVIANYCKVDRIIARSPKRNMQNRWDYQVKWCGLPYSECTWEDETLLRDFQKEINAFEMRQENPCVPKQNSKPTRQRPRFVPITRQPDWLKGLELRDYQLMGVNWMAHSWCKSNSVILADEMGLGKTIQSITFFSWLYHTHEIYGLFLIIVPLSTMTAWQNEFQIWAPHMNVIVYMGDQTSRATIRDVEWLFPNKHYKFNAVLTSYEILLKDKVFLGSHSWVVIAVDEAHRLKNDDSLLYKSLKEFRSEHRLLITGTPLQNSLKELWALLHFIMPEKFSSWSDFEDEHAQNRDSGYASLHKVLQPFLLRRQKKDVEKSLPSKVEQILRVPLSSLQKQYYKWLLTKNYAALSRGTRAGFSSFCNIVMELKKCCNHGYLIKPPELVAKENDVILQNLLRSSGKMVLLDKLLMRLRENNHRVLIFSQMVRMLDIIQDYLILRRLQFQRLDGSVSSDKRRRALDHFNAPGSEDFCFLLSTRAGGLGINLATADTVIIFDSDWNPMNDLQAQARAHRIGQKNQVNIYRLVCAGTVEEDIIERAKKKMVLDHLVIQRMDTSGKTMLFKNTTPSSTTNNPFNKEELSAILKFGAEELFQEPTGEEKEPECDIDDILRRAETRQEQTDSSDAAGLLSAFNVATFNYDEEEEVMKKNWDQIIPEKERLKVAEEDRQKQEAELYLPRRARKKIKINTGSDSDNSDSDSSSGDDDGMVDGSASQRKKGKPPRGNEGTDYISGFTTAEVRKFVRSYRKFGDPLNRLDAIARDAELSEQSEADLQRLGRLLYDKLHAMAAAKQNENSQETEETAKQSRGRGPSFRLAGVAVSVKTTLACTDDLQPLVDCIPRDAEERKSFRISIPVRPVRNWDCSWGPEDDSNLLVGIYEYGMGSWEQIQSDPSLKLNKKILRPNGEMPQAKQLQSRAEYLIKLFRKAQEQNHPGVPQAGSHNRKSNASSVSRDVTSAADEKTKRKSRKIKSKARVEVTQSDVEDDVISGVAHPDMKNSLNNSGEHATVEKKRGRKRKITNDDVNVTAPPAGEKRKKKHHKDTPVSTRTPTKTKRSIKESTDNGGQGTEEFSGELDSETFRDCKERLRPVKKALKQLDRTPMAPSGQEEQAKHDHIRRCLLQIGDRVIECLRELDDSNRVKSLKKSLWIFVSKFTALSADKLYKLYKVAVKRREFERKNKSEKPSKPKPNEPNKSELKTEENLNKSRKIQKKTEKTVQLSPNDGSNDASNHEDVEKNIQGPTNSNQRPKERNAAPSRFRKSPTRKFSDDKQQRGKPAEERDWNRRAGGRSPHPDYRMQRSRSPFQDPRSHMPTRSPDGRMYGRESDFRNRHIRDYPPRSPPRSRPPIDRHWRGHPDFRGSPPPIGEWEHRPPHPPPHRYSPPHHRAGYPPYRPRSPPPGRSPHMEYRMNPPHYRRHPDPYHPDNRGPRSSRYPYGDSPMRTSPGYSPQISDPSLTPGGSQRPDET